MSQLHSLLACTIYSLILLLASAWPIAPALAPLNDLNMEQPAAPPIASLNDLNMEQPAAPPIAPLNHLNIEQPAALPIAPLNDLNIEQPAVPFTAPLNDINMEQTLTISDGKDIVQDSHLNDSALKSVWAREQLTSSDAVLSDVAMDNVIPHLHQNSIPEKPYQDDFNSTLYGSLQSNAIEHSVETNEQEAPPLGVVTSGVTEDTSTQTFAVNQTDIPLEPEHKTNKPNAARLDMLKKRNVTSQPYEQDFDLLESILFQSTQKSEVSDSDDITENTLDPYQFDHLANTVQLGQAHAATVDEMDSSWNSTKLTITLQSHEDSVTTVWAYESNDTRVTGFLVTYRINKREHYDSSKLGKNVRSFTLHSLHEDEDYVICVHAMVNTTAVKEACAHWNESSMKIVVGIMAGILFLIPCIVVVIWILVKDRRVRQKMGCGKEKGDIIQKQKLVKVQKCQDKHSHCNHANSCHTVVGAQNELHKTTVGEDHTDSEDELWKRQSRVGQSLVIQK